MTSIRTGAWLALPLSLTLLACGSGAVRTPAPAPPPAGAASATPTPEPVDPGRDERLTAILWAQTSAEYRVLATSTYAQARAALDRALADPTWTAAVEQTGDYAALPPAVIADVDETVLDNTPHGAELVLAGKRFGPATWKPWVERAIAEPVPGADAFARYAAERGVTMFYVTNRDADEEDATRRNLLAQGFPVSEAVDAVLTQGEKPEYVSDKTSRRAEVARTHRVLLVIGDDLNDFVAGARALPEERIAVAERHAARWGTSWFLLPNSEYGSWERALVANERGLSLEETRRRKVKRLRLPPAEP